MTQYDLDLKFMKEAIAWANDCVPKRPSIPKVGAIIAAANLVLGRGRRGNGLSSTSALSCAILVGSSTILICEDSSFHDIGRRVKRRHIRFPSAGTFGSMPRDYRDH